MKPEICEPCDWDYHESCQKEFPINSRQKRFCQCSCNFIKDTVNNIIGEMNGDQRFNEH
jgi:hypothetical protein